MNTVMLDQVAVAEASFAQRYCKKYQCSAVDFEKSVFWRCLSHSFTSPLARLVWVLKRDFFKIDLILISKIKDATTFAEVRDVVMLYSLHPPNSNVMREWFKIRISRRKLLSLANAMLNDGNAE